MQRGVTSYGFREVIERECRNAGIVTSCGQSEVMQRENRQTDYMTLCLQRDVTGAVCSIYGAVRRHDARTYITL